MASHIHHNAARDVPLRTWRILKHYLSLVHAESAELPATFANTQDFLIDLHWFGSPLKKYIKHICVLSKTRWHAALQHKRSNDDGQHVHSSVDAVTNVSAFDVSGVTNLYRTFYSAQNFRGNVERWHLTSITTLQETFRYARGGFSKTLSLTGTCRICKNL